MRFELSFDLREEFASQALRPLVGSKTKFRAGEKVFDAKVVSARVGHTRHEMVLDLDVPGLVLDDGAWWTTGVQGFAIRESRDG